MSEMKGTCKRKLAFLLLIILNQYCQQLSIHHSSKRKQYLYNLEDVESQQPERSLVLQDPLTLNQVLTRPQYFS